MITTIIWDWNGTLLNDTDICLKAMNQLLVKRNQRPLTKSHYRNIFTFPVKDYYIKAGIDLYEESFDVIALEFMELYWENLNEAKLFHGVIEILEIFQGYGFSQVLISAMEHNSLVNSVEKREIIHFFNHISGIHDHFANGKDENAEKIVKKLNLDLSTTIMIGDTVHDFEVARKLGIRCLLVANGHQSLQRLSVLGCKVASTITEVPDILNIISSEIYIKQKNTINI